MLTAAMARPAVTAAWAATLLLCVLQLRARRRLARVARACHEVRGPLCAARLGLGTLDADPPRLAAIDLELRRAARSLDDLAGARTTDRRELVDLCALARAHAPAWQAVAAAHGAALRLDVVTEAPPLGVVIPLRPRRARCVQAAPPRGTSPADPAVPAPAAVAVAVPSPADPAVPAPAAVAVPSPSDPAVPAAAAVAGPSPADPAVPGPAAVAVPAPADVGGSPRAADPGAFVLGAPVLGDPLRLAQACANLVANAAEHGAGAVRVRVAVVGDRVRFEVADDGPGLPAPVEALVAAGRSRRSHRGHGLAVAAAVAARHGGRLGAAPAGAGARIVLDLPAAAPARLARRDAAAPPEIVA